MSIIFPVSAVFLSWVAACTDITARLIPNWISICLVVLFAVNSAFELSLFQTLQHVLWAVGVFLVFLLGFVLGKVGGGDVKLAGAMMLWAGPEFGLEFLLVMALAGGALAVMAIVPVFGFVWQWALMRTGLGGLFVPQTGPPSIPYGVAISVAGTFVLYGKYLGHL